MRKIKLISAQLILKKKTIGKLTGNELKNIMEGGETGYGMCTDFTQEGYTCAGESDANRCVSDLIGCPQTLDAYTLPPSTNSYVC